MGHTPSGGREGIEEAPGKRESGPKSYEGIQQVPGPEADREEKFRRERQFRRAQKQSATAMTSLCPTVLSGGHLSCLKAPYTWKKPQTYDIIIMLNVTLFIWASWAFRKLLTLLPF